VSTPPRGWTDHAIHRAAERYGIAFEYSEWAQMLLDIMDTAAGVRVAAMLAGKSAQVEELHVFLGGVAVRAVYDPMTATVVTIAPR